MHGRDIRLNESWALSASSDWEESSSGMVGLSHDVRVEELLAARFSGIFKRFGGDEHGVDPFQKLGIVHFQNPAALFVVVHRKRPKISNRMRDGFPLSPSLEGVFRWREPSARQVKGIE